MCKYKESVIHVILSFGTVSKQNANLTDHNQKPPSKRFLHKTLLLSDTSWHEQNSVHVEKHIQTSTAEHCQDLLSTCNFY